MSWIDVPLADLTGGIRPLLMYFGGVNSGNPYSALGGPPVGTVDLITGIDIYGNVQPQNAEVQVYVADPRSYGGNVTVYLVQQSQNFPGPFHYRGMFPLLSSTEAINVTATGPFSFLIWGVRTPDWTL